MTTKDEALRAALPFVTAASADHHKCPYGTTPYDAMDTITAIEAALSAQGEGVKVEWRGHNAWVGETRIGAVDTNLRGEGWVWRRFGIFASSYEHGEALTEAEARAAVEASFRAVLALLGSGVPVDDTPPALPNASQYYAKDKSGQWHYVNHAGTWQTCPPPFASALPADERARAVLNEGGEDA